MRFKSRAFFIVTWLLISFTASNSWSKNSQKFNVLPHTDLPGYDYRTPKNDSSLRNITSKGCVSACAQDNRCGAFTYNSKARVCFLKTGVGTRKKFRGAFSGIKLGKRDNSKTANSDFRLLQSIDLPGFDYRNPKNDPTLRNTGVSGCMQACQQDTRCKAFTYNTNVNWCLLKSGFSQRTSFRGAISGTKTNNPNPVDTATVADEKTTTEFGYEYLTSGPSAPRACNDELPDIEQLQQSVKIETDDTKVAVGDMVKVRWSRGDLPKHRVPVYLMISTKTPVRFKGNGFYALLPNAKAAFDIPTYKNTTRAIVPLYGKGVATSGVINIKPILAEKLELNWSVVGYTRKCGKTHASENTPIEIAVRTGTPRIVVDDPFSLKKPKERFISPDGERILEVFEGHYRVVNKTGSVLVATRQGVKPRFTPTGRFVTAYLAEEIEAIDVLSGDVAFVTGNPSGGYVSWKNNDSFAIFPSGHDGTNIINTLQLLTREKLHSKGNFWSMPAKGSYASVGSVNPIKIDLENNFILTESGTGIDAMSLTADLLYTREGTAPWNKSQVRELIPTVLKMVYQSSGTAKLHFPTDWIHDPHLVLTNLYKRFDGVKDPWAQSDNSFKEKNHFEKFLVKRNPFTTAAISSRTEAPDGKKIMRSASWRTAGGLDEKSQPKKYRKRLDDFGIPLLDGKQPSFDGKKSLKTLGFSENGKIYAIKGVKNLRLHHDAWCTEDNRNSRVINLCMGWTASDLRIHGWKVGTRTIAMLAGNHEGGNRGFVNPIAYIYDSNDKSLVRDLIKALPDSHNVGTLCSYQITACNFSARLVKDRYLVFWSKESLAVAFYDLKKRQLALAIHNLPKGEILQSVSLAADKYLLISYTDESFSLYSSATKKIILQGRYEDDEIIVWTPDGHFDATTEGAHFAKLEFPGRSGQYTFAQFDERLRVPGLTQKIMNGETISGPTWKDVGVPPALIAELSENDDKRVVGKAAIDADQPIKTVNIFQDGVLTNSLEPGSNGEVAIDVPRLPGARWISAVAVDENGLVSQPIGGDLGEDGDKTKLHFLTIGIDEYEHANDLSFGKSDAINLSKSLNDIAGKSIVLGVHKTLTDRDASADAILSNIKSIVEQAKKSDTIVFSFAGHGVRDKRGRFYLGTSIIDPADIAGTGLLWNDVVEIFKGSKARIAVFLDACHSGAAGTDDSIYATNDQVVNGLLAGMPPGIVIFSASKGRELSEEDGVRGGIFTNAVTDVISHKRGQFDTNKNGAIEISELYYGVKKQVVIKAKGQQTPWLARNQMVGDYALF